MTNDTPIDPSPRLGVGRVIARASERGSFLAEAHATSPLRLLRPTFPGVRSAAVCLVTFGGGLVDGDTVDTDIEVEAGATLLVFTQSSTKVFRGASSQSIRAKVAGTLVLLPDPVAAFEGASYTQRIDVDLTETGTCLLLDGMTSGRAAFGERWAMRRLDLQTTLRQGERVLAQDALVLDETDGSIAERAGTFEAFLTVLSVRCLAEDLLAPPAPPTRDLAVAVSPLARADDGAIVRIAASSPAAALAAARARLRNLPEIDVVDPFGSRY